MGKNRSQQTVEFFQQTAKECKTMSDVDYLALTWLRATCVGEGTEGLCASKLLGVVGELLQIYEDE